MWRWCESVWKWGVNTPRKKCNLGIPYQEIILACGKFSHVFQTMNMALAKYMTRNKHPYSLETPTFFISFSQFRAIARPGLALALTCWGPVMQFQHLNYKTPVIHMRSMWFLSPFYPLGAHKSKLWESKVPVKVSMTPVGIGVVRLFVCFYLSFTSIAHECPKTYFQ